MLQAGTLKFLKDLKKNNSKEWFDQHRKIYEAAKADYLELVAAILNSYGKKDPTLATLGPKECVFRINRDVRFSKNKDPYKTNMGAYFVQGGKKSILAGYYLHCEPGKSFVGGGLYMAEPDKIKKVRQEIDYNWSEFQEIIGHKQFKKVYGGLSFEDGMSLLREPRGYEKDNPAIEYIKLKNWIAAAPLKDADLTDQNLVKKVTEAFTALQPLVQFLNRAMEG